LGLGPSCLYSLSLHDALPILRFAVVAVLLCMLAAGLGYTYSQESPTPTFLTAPVERGSVATLVKASGTVEAVITVDVSSQLSGQDRKSTRLNSIHGSISYAVF